MSGKCQPRLGSTTTVVWFSSLLSVVATSMAARSGPGSGSAPRPQLLRLQMGVGLTHAVLAVPLDRPPDPLVEGKSRLPAEVTLGSRRVKQDRGGVIFGSGPHLDLVLQLDFHRAHDRV